MKRFIINKHLPYAQDTIPLALGTASSFPPFRSCLVSPQRDYPAHSASILYVSFKISHTTQFTHLKCRIQWLSVYSQSCASITTINFRTFSLPQNKPHTYSHQFPNIRQPSSPRQPRIYSVLLWICPFWAVCVNRIIQSVVFYSGSCTEPNVFTSQHCEFCCSYLCVSSLRAQGWEESWPGREAPVGRCWTLQPTAQWF